MNDVASAARVLRIQLYGGLRQAREHPELEVTVEPSDTVATLRERVARQFEDDAAARNLLEVSAFATDRRVLDDDEAVPADANLALLPPVCGG